MESVVGPFVATMDLVTVGHSVHLEHIVADYIVVMVPSYIVVVPPSMVEVQTAAPL